LSDETTKGAAAMIHHIFACKSNIGDWLSARGIQSLLAPLPIREHLCDEPFVAGTLERLSSLTPTDLIVIGGGGLFMDYFAPFWEGFRKVARRVPFCIWGVGYCDLKREMSRAPRRLLAEIVRQSRLCILRDDLTRRHLSDCALPPPVPCPSVVAVEPHGGGFGLVHALHYDSVGPEADGTIRAAAIGFAEDSGRSYHEIDNQIADGSAEALAATLRLYAEADLVLSSRLHGCIIGLAMGRKVLAVSGDHKVESFMRAARLSEWVCDLDDLQSVPARLAALEQQRTPRAFVARARRDNRSIAATIRAMALSLDPAPA
jgi:polysaccharide pyruvyl transferase WcaK-like protein